jgi:hypothetical protein
MTVESHLAALEKRREALKKEIEQYEARPSIDQTKIAGLKRQKLQIKDEIQRLRESAPLPQTTH